MNSLVMNYPAPDYIVWNINETEEELRASLSHPEYFADKVQNLKPGSRRLLEVLAVRRALKELFYGEEQRVVYDEHGKPSLADLATAAKTAETSSQGKKLPFISISHTQGYAAVISSKVPVGIDIERIGNRVEKVISHFLKEEELVTLSMYTDQVPALHLAWSAKEAAFKILGQEFYDLQHLTTVTHVDTEKKILLLAVKGRTQPLIVHFDSTDEYVLAWVQDDMSRNC